jgi:hypothetical protein
VLRKSFVLFLVLLLNVSTFAPGIMAAESVTTSSNDNQTFMPKYQQKERTNPDSFQAKSSSIAEVFVESNKSFVKPGETFDVTVYVEDVQDLYGASIDISFDNTSVQAISAQPGGLFGELTDIDTVTQEEVESGTHRGYFYQTIDNEFGEINFGSFLVDPEPSIYGSGYFAVLTFQALETGLDTELFLTVSDSRDEYDGGFANTLIQLSNSNAEPIVYDGYEYAYVTIVNSVIGGTVYEFNDWWYIPVTNATLELIDENAQVKETVTASTYGSYNFSSPDITVGTYTLRVTAPGYDDQEVPVTISDLTEILNVDIDLVPMGLYNLVLNWEDPTQSTQLELDLHIDVYDQSTDEFLYSIAWYNKGMKDADPYITLLNDDYGYNGQEEAVIYQGVPGYRYEVYVENYSDYFENSDTNVSLSVVSNGQVVNEYQIDPNTTGNIWNVNRFTIDGDGSITFLGPEVEIPEPLVHGIYPYTVYEDNVSFKVEGKAFDYAEQVEVWLVEQKNYNFDTASAKGNKFRMLNEGSFKQAGTVGDQEPVKFPTTISNITSTTFDVYGVDVPSGNYYVEVYFDGVQDYSDNTLKVRPSGAYVEEQFSGYWEHVVLPYPYVAENHSFYLPVYNVELTSPSFQIALIPLSEGLDTQLINIDNATLTMDFEGTSYYSIHQVPPSDIPQGKYMAELRIFDGSVSDTPVEVVPLTKVIVGDPHITWYYPNTLLVNASKVEIHVNAYNVFVGDEVQLAFYSTQYPSTPALSTTDIDIRESGSDHYAYLTGYLDNISGLTPGDYEMVLWVNGTPSLPKIIQVSDDPMLSWETTPWVNKSGETSFYTWIEGYNLEGQQYTASLIAYDTGEVLATSDSFEIVTLPKSISETALQLHMVSVDSTKPISPGYYYLQVTSDTTDIKDLNGWPYQGTQIYFTDMVDFSYNPIPYEIDAGVADQKVTIYGVYIAGQQWGTKIYDEQYELVADLGQISAIEDAYGREYMELTLPALPAGEYTIEFTDADGNYVGTSWISVTGDQVVEPDPAVVTSIHIIGAESITIPTSGSTTANYTATVMDQYGYQMTDETLTWSLVSSIGGVTVDSSTGVVTVNETAEVGSFDLMAISDTDSSVTASKFITLEEEQVVAPEVTSIEITGENSITIPSSDSTTSAYTAIVKDQDGLEMENETVTWSLASTVTGVSVDPQSGVVTVDNTAGSGTIELVATSITDSTVKASITISLLSEDTIIPQLVFDKGAYARGSLVNLGLKLINLKGDERTNSVTFEIEYDDNTFELATGDPNVDIQDGYITFTTKSVLESGSNKKVSVMYTNLTDTQLQENEALFTVNFRVKADATLGSKTFTLKPIEMLDSDFNVYNVNNGMEQTATTTIANHAILNGSLSLYLGDSSTGLSNLILSKLNQDALNNTVKDLTFTVVNEITGVETVFTGSEVLVPDSNGQLASKNEENQVVGTFVINVADLDSTKLIISGAGYLAKEVVIELNAGEENELGTLEIYPGDLGHVQSGVGLVLTPEGKVTNVDFSAWLKVFKEIQSGIASPEDVIRADLTKDGVVTNIDFSLWLASFKKIQSLGQN